MLEHTLRAAKLSKPVLVIGERSTGQELIASRLHYRSERSVIARVAALGERVKRQYRCVLPSFFRVV